MPTGAKIPETQYLEQALMLLTQNSQASPFATRIIGTISCIHLWDMHFNQQTQEALQHSYSSLIGLVGIRTGT
jgi:hypothetical protein